MCFVVVVFFIFIKKIHRTFCMQTVETLIGASDPGLNEFVLIVDFLNDSYFVKNNVFNKKKRFIKKYSV